MGKDCRDRLIEIRCSNDLQSAEVREKRKGVGRPNVIICLETYTYTVLYTFIFVWFSL